VRQYQKHAHSLKKDFNLKGDLSIAEMIRLPGVVEVSETTLDPEVMRPAIEKNVLKALKSMEQMREREGRSLFLDLGRQLASMKAEARKIEQRARAILKEKKKTLSMEEMASFQKSNDINEEIARLLHYVDEFKKFLKTSQPTGKKLDFIAQEMQRETNTIGSKVQDKVVSGAVITLKSKIEKIREQAQNIE